MVRSTSIKNKSSPTNQASKRSPKKSKDNFGVSPSKKRLKIGVTSQTDDDFEEETLAARKERISSKGKQISVAQDSASKIQLAKCKGKKKITFEEEALDGAEAGAKSRTKNNKDKSKENEHAKIKWRGNLNLFVETLSKISSEQRKLVQDAGFGSLLRLTAFELPEYLCRYLVEKFIPLRGEIILEDACVLDLEDEDVEICLGIPRGRTEIVKVDSTIMFDCVHEWRKHIGGNKHDIRNPSVVEKILDPKNLGSTFLTDFIVLFHSCLVEPTQSGATNQSLIRNLVGITPQKLSEMNWCQFVINALAEGKRKWISSPSSMFTGSLFLLTILYLDRVVVFNKRSVPRQFPAFLGWTTTLVKNREHTEIKYGGFGYGKVKERQALPPPTKKIEEVKSHGAVSQSTGNNDHNISSIEVFNRTLGLTLEELASIVVKIRDLMKNMPNEGQQDDVSKALIDTTKSFLDSSTDEAADVISSQILQAVSFTQDPIWNDPELHKMMDKIDAGINCRREILQLGGGVYVDPFQVDGHTTFEKGDCSTEHDRTNKLAEETVIEILPISTPLIIPNIPVVEKTVADMPPLTTSRTTDYVQVPTAVHSVSSDNKVEASIPKKASISKKVEASTLVRRTGRDRHAPQRFQ